MGQRNMNRPAAADKITQAMREAEGARAGDTRHEAIPVDPETLKLHQLGLEKKREAYEKAAAEDFAFQQEFLEAQQRQIKQHPIDASPIETGARRSRNSLDSTRRPGEIKRPPPAQPTSRWQNLLNRLAGR